MAVDDEAEVFGHLIVQSSARLVGGLRLPIDATCTGGLSPLLDGPDEGFANPLAALLRVSEEVLQVADWLNPGGASVK